MLTLDLNTEVLAFLASPTVPGHAAVLLQQDFGKGACDALFCKYNWYPLSPTPQQSNCKTITQLAVSMHGVSKFHKDLI